MKLRELFEEDGDIEMDPTRGAGYSDTSKPERGKLTTYLLRRKAEKNNPTDGDDTAPDGTTTDSSTGDDPDNREKGAGLQGGPSV